MVTHVGDKLDEFVNRPRFTYFSPAEPEYCVAVFLHQREFLIKVALPQQPEQVPSTSKQKTGD